MNEINRAKATVRTDFADYPADQERPAGFGVPLAVLVAVTGNTVNEVTRRPGASQ